MPRRNRRNSKPNKRVTRYTYDEVKEPRTHETGHTALLPAEEQVITLPMDNGWSKAIEVGRLRDGEERPVVVDMDPVADPVLFWAGKRNMREVPVLPLQRNEIVTESRIARIIERTRTAVAENKSQTPLFAELEKRLRETNRSKRVEFYKHDEGWKNKLICGDSLQVMESLLHYEGLHGKVQMIYIDPPYGIKYDSNFQQRIDTTINEEGDTADDVLTIKAFQDTWSLGIHSYLSYLQGTLYLCRDLLTDSGSVFVQISVDNMHRVRLLMDEVLGSNNLVCAIAFAKTTGQYNELLPTVADYILWYAKSREQVKFRPIFLPKAIGGVGSSGYDWVESPDGRTIRRLTREEHDDPSLIPRGSRVFAASDLTSSHYNPSEPFEFKGKQFSPGHRYWSTHKAGLGRLAKIKRLIAVGRSLRFKRYHEDFGYFPLTSFWTDTSLPGFASGRKVYVVQTNPKVVDRCLLMTTEPGDLVFDPTCGSGTTAMVAEERGRRWITCDTSRVALNVARTRLLSAVFDHYLTQNGAVASGFRYKTQPRITMKSLANELEPEKVELFDQPEVDPMAIRVTGPFEVMSLGRYSVEDWKGYFVREPASAFGEPAKLENYIDVICRLYRKDAAIQGATGLIHAVAETEKEKIAISVGPLSGRVTAKQINDAVQDALASGILEVHVLGWAFEANVGEVKSQLEARGKVKVELIMIRPDTLAEGLKITRPEMLFSPLALPDIEVKVKRNNKVAAEAVVTLKGVALFDRKNRRTEYKRADSGYVSAWYLDEDYDGDCFVDCQIFFDYKKAPNLQAALKAEVDPEEFQLQLTSEPFALRGYKRIAVKVVDVYGNESTVVSGLG